MDDAKLDELLRRCEVVHGGPDRAGRAAGVRDARLDAVAASRGAGLLSLPRVDGSVITAETPDDLIDRFLREEDLRIVVRNDQPESASEQVRTEAELSDEEGSGERGAGRNLPCAGVALRGAGRLPQIKFAKSGKKCLLCQDYRTNRNK